MTNSASKIPAADSRTPEERILEKVTPYLDKHEIFGNRILVAIYKRDQVTKGGIILHDNALQEDVYQGVTGYVLQVGPEAFKDTDKWKFGGQRVNKGEWVTFRPSDGVLCQFGGSKGQECRVFQDCYVIAKVASPDVVY